MTERRRYARNTDGADTPVEILISDKHGYRMIEARLINYSIGGLRLQTDDDDIRLGMLIVIKAFNGRPLLEDELEGRVSWIMEVGGQLHFGCEYTMPFRKTLPFFHGEA